MKSIFVLGTVHVEAESSVADNENGRKGIIWMGAGLFLFGSTVGLSTGLSEASGISGTLLSSLFTFAGGVLLSYAGFRGRARKLVDGGGKEDSPREPDLQQVGIGMSFFSGGVILGLLFGIWLRVTNPWGWQQLGYENLSLVHEVKLPATESKASPMSLHSGDTQFCKDVREGLRSGQYSNEEGSKRAISDLRFLVEKTCPAP